MYIRKVSLKKNNKSYSSYKLVESIRTERGPRQRVILNLGSVIELPEEQWPDLALRIEELIRGTKTLIPFESEVEALAQKFAKQAIKKQSQAIVSSAKERTEIPDFQTVDLNSLKQKDIRSIGAEHLLLSTLKKLKLDQTLKGLGLNNREIKLAIGSIIARAIFPGSERSTLEKLRSISGLDDLLEINFSSVSEQRMYQIADSLYSQKDSIEKALYEKECEVFDLEETIILYDLTNTYLEGTGSSNPSAKRGRSKEKRSDCPLITLGLVLDEQGFCKRSRIFEGNISEGSTLEEMVEGLKDPDELSRRIVVLDAGIATESNLKWLREKENPFEYIVVSRKRKSIFPDDQVPVIITNKNQKEIRVILKENEASNEMELYCHSEDKEKKEQQIKNHFQMRFEEELNKLNTGLHKKGCTKKWDKVLVKLGRLKEKYSRVTGLYTIDLKKSMDSQNADSITWSVNSSKEETTFKGTYCLRTNIKDFSEERIWKTYTMLTNVEAAFRSMKSELGLRPIFHQKEERTAAHLFITVLAYHLVHTIRYQLAKHNIRYSWTTIRDAIANHVRATIQMKRKDGKMISIRKASEPELFHKKIYNALAIDHYPGTIEKTIL